MEHVVIENFRAMQPDAKTAPSSTITGIPDAKPDGILVRNAYIEMPGGATALPATPVDHDGQYPQSNQFGPGARLCFLRAPRRRGHLRSRHRDAGQAGCPSRAVHR